MKSSQIASRNPQWLEMCFPNFSLKSLGFYLGQLGGWVVVGVWTESVGQHHTKFTSSQKMVTGNSYQSDFRPNYHVGRLSALASCG